MVIIHLSKHGVSTMITVKNSQIFIAQNFFTTSSSVQHLHQAPDEGVGF